MNKQLKLLQRSKVLKTLEVEKVKHDLSKIKNSTIVMVAYDDATDKFLIGDNSGDLYVATSEYLKSLDIKNSSIGSIINGLTKSSIAQHFNKISLQEAKEMFGKKYLYYWSANNRIYGVKRGLIERLDNGPDDTTVVNLWSRTENVLSNDRGVTGLRDVKFSSELRPAFLTFDEEAIPTYTRDQNLVVRDPVKIADIMNKDIQNHDYVPKDDKYGYDMKDSNAVMKAYLGTDDLVVLSNIDKRQVVDIDPPNTDPDNPDVVYNNNTPFNHNYNMVWSTIRSARLFEEFNDEANDNNSNFANMTRHEQNELTNFTVNKHVDSSGLYANVPNLYETYTTYIEGDTFGDKQIYNNGGVGVSIKNEIKWSLDKINGTTCTITKRVYNSITGEVTTAKKTYDGVVDFEIVDIKDTTARIKKTFRIPILNNAICDFNKFEYKHDATGTAISLPIPAEYEDGIVEYNLDTSTYEQGTNGTISYGMRKVFIQSGATKYFLNSTNGTGTAAFSAYTLTASNIKSATIKRDTEIIFKNTDNTNYSYKTTNNAIGTGSVEYLVAYAPTGVKDGNHISRHTRNIHYMSGSIDVICDTAFSDPIVNYEIYTLAANKTTATLKGSSTGVFNTIDKGIETETSYNIGQSRHITVTSNPITYTRNAETYTSATNIKCSQTMNIGYTYDGVTIKKSITEEASITHSVYTLESGATTATIKREFRPVFYTYSAGVKSGTSIYKNDIVEIDKNQIANVTYTVSDSATGISGSNHLATHTRKVVYTQGSVSVNVNTINVDAVVNYKIYTLELNKTTATFVGSSTGTFKTYKNGSETSTTYNIAKTNHISVTSAPGIYSDSAVNYTSSSATCTRTLSFGYTYKNVTVKLSIAKSAAVSHSLYNLTSDGATVKRVYTPVFKTITNGVETTSNYEAKEVTIDTNQSATVNYSVTNTVDKAENGNHYSTHTRTVTYKPNSASQTYYTLLIDDVFASITYSWKDISSSSKQFYGSSTATFKTYSEGKITANTYNKTQSNHLTVNCTITEEDKINTYTANSKTAYLQLKGSYTHGGITKELTRNSSNASITHTLTTLTSDNVATITRSYSPTIKCMSNGSETTDNYKSGARSLSNLSGTVTYDDLSSAVTGSGSTIKRHVKYTVNDVETEINTVTSTNSNSYSIVKHTGSTATFKNTISAKFKTIVNGAASTEYVGKTAISDVTTGTVSHVIDTYSDDNTKSATLYLKYGSTTIKSQAATVSTDYSFSNLNTKNETLKLTRTINVWGTFSGEQTGSEYDASVSHDSTNVAPYSFLCQYGVFNDASYITVYPVMGIAESFSFGKYVNGTYTTSSTYSMSRKCDYNYNRYTETIPYSVKARASGMEGAMVVQYLYPSDNIDAPILNKGCTSFDSSEWFLGGTSVSGSVASVTYARKGPINGYYNGSAIFTIVVSGKLAYSVGGRGTLYIPVSASTEETLSFNGSAYLEVSGTQYSWSYYYRTNTVTCSHGGKLATARFRSPSYYSTNKSRPTSVSPVPTWWDKAWRY